MIPIVRSATTVAVLCWWLVEASASTQHQHALRGPLSALFRKPIPPRANDGVDPGEPLFLTPLIASGQIAKARSLSLVEPIPGTNVTSYSGYLTVNSAYNSNMFFWFFPAQSGDTNAPVLLWLQGGPGGTSMFGLFVENGPFFVDAENNLNPRLYSWNTKYSVIYIDNPVGTGFSFTDADAGFAQNENDVARDLYSALTQFFTLFNEYQLNDFYVTGESYAGKYGPAISYKIHIENPTAQLKINLKGMAIGDGWCDPETMIPAYAPFLFNIGLLSENERDYFAKYADLGVAYIQAGLFHDAFVVLDFLLDGDAFPYPPWFVNRTGLNFYYNYLLAQEPPDFEYFNNFLAGNAVRKAIHVGNQTFSDGSLVEAHLIDDEMDTVKPWIAALLDNNYKVLLYSGLLDIIVALPLTEAFLQTVPWSGLDAYKTAEKRIWKINPADVDVAGYVRNAKNLWQVGVRGAGHILPYDQPQRSYVMIDNFVSGKSFDHK